MENLHTDKLAWAERVKDKYITGSEINNEWDIKSCSSLQKTPELSKNIHTKTTW